jgi:hypothetical protein
MIVTNHEGKPVARLGYGVVFIVLAISFVLLGSAEAIAQGTNTRTQPARQEEVQEVRRQ